MYSDEELLEEIDRMAKEKGRTPKVKDIRNDSDISFTAFHNHFGSWNDSLRAAGYEVNEDSVTVECHYCSNQLTMPKNRVEKQERVFCEGCTQKWRSDRWQGENNPRYSEEVEVECVNCGETHKRKPFRVEGRDWFFCDQDCQLEWNDENYHGEGNPNWNGGATMYATYGPNWYEKRETIIESQNKKCRACGVSQDDMDLSLEVHHIHPVAEYQNGSGEINWDEANDEDNLVALCPQCHHQWEGMPVIPN